MAFDFYEAIEIFLFRGLDYLHNSKHRSLIANCAVTLGRLASVCPEVVSPYMGHVMLSWCTNLAGMRDNDEKEDAFQGLCYIVKSNPSGELSSVVSLFRAIASWHEMSEDLQSEVSQVLLCYQQILPNCAWEECMFALEPPEIEKLKSYVH